MFGEYVAAQVGRELMDKRGVEAVAWDLGNLCVSMYQAVLVFVVVRVVEELLA